MSSDPPTPDNNLGLRRVRSLRRAMHGTMEGQARGFDDARREVREVTSDLIVMENRVPTAQSDIVRRVDDGSESNHDTSHQA